MRVYGHRSRIAIYGIVGLLGACGGGGGSGYSTPPPTVTFSSPAQATTINLGQGVKLGWTSSNAMSCSGSMSSSMGGAFSGTQPMSGATTAAPIATGTVTYTVTCMGAGGTGSASTPVVTVNPNVLSTLATIVTIGSTVDPMEGGNNPYGLVIAPATAGLITQGDLVVCNFNDGATMTQGAGTTIVGLHPTPGAKPYRIAQSASLKGCNALTMLPDDSISAAGYSANQNPLVTAAGVVNTPFSSDTLGHPWGEAYAAANGQNPAALYVSNMDGSIDRVALNGDAQSSFTKILTGFCGAGAPGSIYAPAGLTYDPSIDTLYVVDTSSYSVVALANVASIGAGGVTVNGQCPSSNPTYPTPMLTFAGPSATSARVIANGGPLIAPISAALLADGDLIVGNGDIGITSSQMPNLAVEVSPSVPGGFVGQPKQLDTSGIAGALFGIAATTDGQGNQIIYFNDDSSTPTSVMRLSK